MNPLLYILVFPGFLFFTAYSLVCEYIDRKFYAKLQNRVGPPFIQPLADLIKLLSKEDIVPSLADRRMFSAVPIAAFASVAATFLYIPIWSDHSVFPFNGDLLVVLFLLTIPALAVFLAGWHSTNFFSQIGALRSITQHFGYEVSFFISMLTPALLSGSWSISDIISYESGNFLVLPFLIPALIIGLISLQGKLERIPFDIPEAETEIVAGTLVEYSGRRLAMFRLAFDMEMVACAFLISALFLGGPYLFPSFNSALIDSLLGFASFIIKTALVVIALSYLRALFARLRIEQMVSFCYRWLIPIGFIQLLFILILKYGGIS